MTEGEYDLRVFIFAAILAVFVVAGLMSAYKGIYYTVTKKSTNRFVNQILAWIFCVIRSIPKRWKRKF